MATLDELEAMERAATAGPWDGSVGVVTIRKTWEVIARTTPEHLSNGARDALLIAAARNALPDLIATVRAGIALYESRGVNDCGTDDGACLNRETCESCAFRAALARLNGGAG